MSWRWLFDGCFNPAGALSAATTSSCSDGKSLLEGRPKPYPVATTVPSCAPRDLSRRHDRKSRRKSRACGRRCSEAAERRAPARRRAAPAHSRYNPKEWTAVANRHQPNGRGHFTTAIGGAWEQPHIRLGGRPAWWVVFRMRRQLAGAVRGAPKTSVNAGGSRFIRCLAMHRVLQRQVRHPPRSGWLDELGRLKDGSPMGLDVARCAPCRWFQNCPTAPSAASCSRMYVRTCSSSNPTVDTA